MKSASKPMALPLLCLLLSFCMVAGWEWLGPQFGLLHGSTGAEIGRIMAESATILSLTVLVMRGVRVILWQQILERRTGAPVPKVLTGLTDGILLIIGTVLIIAYVLDKPVTGFITTSSVMMAVVGLALRGMISGLFSGIAISLERQYQVGDWIDIGGSVGKIVEMSWRTTGILLDDGTYTVIPNNRLSEIVVKVYSRPTLAWRDQIDIMIGYDENARDVERVLLSSARQIKEIAAQPKAPDVRIVDFGEQGVKWRLRFWVPDYPSRSKLRYQLLRNILRNLAFADISPAEHKVLNVVRRDAPHVTQSAESILSRSDLFGLLDPQELSALAAQARTCLLDAGQPVVQIGEEGESLFVVKEGLLEVLLPNQTDGVEKIVARLGPGMLFGEMSLLTGSPRRASVRASVDSVLYEITKDVMQPILHRNPLLLEGLSQTLAQRQIENDKAMLQPPPPDDGGMATQSLARHLLGRMRVFFGMDGVSNRSANV